MWWCPLEAGPLSASRLYHSLILMWIIWVQWITTLASTRVWFYDLFFCDDSNFISYKVCSRVTLTAITLINMHIGYSSEYRIVHKLHIIISIWKYGVMLKLRTKFVPIFKVKSLFSTLVMHRAELHFLIHPCPLQERSTTCKYRATLVHMYSTPLYRHMYATVQSLWMDAQALVWSKS